MESKQKMNGKKVIIFLLFLIIGFILFALASLGSGFISLLTILSFIAYVLVLASAINAYSNKKLALLIVIVFMYSAISLVPFKKCSGEGWTTIQTCTCEGIEEQGVIVYDFKETRCIGIIADKECYHIDPRTGIKDKINCTN